MLVVGGWSGRRGAPRAAFVLASLSSPCSHANVTVRADDCSRLLMTMLHVPGSLATIHVHAHTAVRVLAWLALLGDVL